MEDHIYNVGLQWTVGRKGILSSPELDSSFEVATPPQFANGIRGIWSPEHLLTAAVSSCLMTTFLAIAENSKLEFVSFSCSASGKLGTVDGKLQMTEITLQPVVDVTKEEDKARAERIIQKSEAACLISNSIKAKINLIIQINVKAK